MARATVRWNPFREMAMMQSALDRMFDDSWQATGGILGRHGFAIDIFDAGDAYTLYADMPGLSEDQINIRLENGVLTISAEVEPAEVPEGAKVLVQERGPARYSRSVNLAQTVNPDEVEATYHNGVLELHLPKAPEARVKQIPVKFGDKMLKSGS